MSEENEFNMYKNIVNNYFRTATFEKAKELCARDMVQLNQRYITEAVCRNEALNRVDKLQKENEELHSEISQRIKLKIENEKIGDELYKTIDKLQKENKKYIDAFNSTEKIMNGQERTKDKLLKENVELQKENANKDKVIDLMAEHLFNIRKMPYRTNIFTKEELIQKYYEEVGDIE